MKTPPISIVKKAYAIINKQLEMDTIPDNDWEAVSDNWDLCMWTDYRKFRASLYEVNDGNIVNSSRTVIFEQDLEKII